MKELLAEKDYRRLVGSQFLGQGGDGLAQAVAATVLILDPLERGTPGRILELFALTLLPYSLISPFMGVFVDRWDRRKLLIGTNLGRALLLLLFPLWERMLPRDTALMVLVLGVLGFGRLFSTTKGAVIPVLLHDRYLLRGNAVSSIVGIIGGLTGGIIGLWYVGTLDVGPALAAIGTIHLLAALSAGRIEQHLAHVRVRAETLAEAVVRVASELVSGVRESWVRAPARLSLLGIFFLRTSGMVVVIIAILWLKQRYPGGAGHSDRQFFGAVLLGVSGAGAFLASISLSALRRRMTKPFLIVAGFVISGGALVLLGGLTSPSSDWAPVALGAATCFGGYGGLVTKVSVDAQVQETLPDEFRGRAFALYDILYNFASVAAGVVTVLTEDVSLMISLVGTGVVTLGLSGLLTAAMGRAGMLGEDFARPRVG